LDFSFRAESGDGGPNQWLKFERDVETGKTKFQISGYKVGEEVVDAWKIKGPGEERNPEVTGRGGGRVEFEKWPPA
jgi:hypothetical protein